MSGVAADMPALDERRRGTVLEALGSYDNAVAVDCFSKARSVFGAFVAGGKGLQRLVRMRAGTYLFGGPLPPPSLDGNSAVGRMPGDAKGVV
jgi:7-keto-8-aminopelargonate synthetase-like enzyme